MIWLITALAMGQQADTLPNAQLLHPTIDGTHTLWTDDSGSAGQDGFTAARGMFSYTRKPFVFLPTGESEAIPVVRDVLQANLLAGYTVERFRFGLDVPVHLYAIGQPGTGEAGLGDVAADVRARLVDREQTQGLGAAVTGRLVLPTSSSDLALGMDQVRGELAGIVDYSTGPARFAANVGVRFSPNVELENVELGEQVFARLGGGAEVAPGIGVSVDLAANLNLADKASNRAGIPVEMMVGGWGQLTDTLSLRGGLGRGVTRGIGSPAFRAMVGLAYAPSGPRLVVDQDGDTITDSMDACPQQAEDVDGFEDTDGCPELDNDSDGILDTLDACPDEPEDLDGYEDTDGCAESAVRVRVVVVNPTGDIVGNASSHVHGTDVSYRDDGEFDVVLEPGLYTLGTQAEGYEPYEQRFNVPLGEPLSVGVTLQPLAPLGSVQMQVLSEDGTPVPGVTWAIQGQDAQEVTGSPVSFPPGEYTLRFAAEGFAAVSVDTSVVAETVSSVSVVLPTSRVVLSGERIDLQEKVFFNTGRATIQPASFSLLDEVADVMNNHPEITRVRIEGHTDSRGSESSNLLLSQNRADSVRRYLTRQGVEEDRLQAVGFGEARPLDAREVPEAWDKNRRVEMFILDRD